MLYTINCLNAPRVNTRVETQKTGALVFPVMRCTNFFLSEIYTQRNKDCKQRKISADTVSLNTQTAFADLRCFKYHWNDRWALQPATDCTCSSDNCLIKTSLKAFVAIWYKCLTADVDLGCSTLISILEIGCSVESKRCHNKIAFKIYSELQHKFLDTF